MGNKLQKTKEFEEIDSILERMNLLMDSQLLELSIIREIIDYFILHKLNKKKDILYQKFITLFEYQIQILIKNYNEQKTVTNYYKIVNILIILMIIIYNSRKNKNLILFMFDRNSDMTKSFVLLIKSINKHDVNKRIEKIISNLMTSDYKIIFFENKIEELYYANYDRFSKIITSSNSRFSKDIYKKMFRYLANFDLDYDKLLKFKIYNNDEKPLIKSLFVQSLIRIIFSTEKEAYLKENSKYEYEFIQTLVRKCLSDYKENCGEKISSLFRKDNLIEDIIKTILYMYGSSFVYSLYIEKLQLDLKEIKNQSDAKFLIEDKFFGEFDGFLNKLLNEIPLMVKFILRIIHEIVLDIYRIEKNNYRPLFTYLFFNFLFSPKLQEIFQISPTNHRFVMNINKVVRNMSFNQQFQEEDELSKYNEIIGKYHLALTDTFDKILASIDVFDEKIFIVMNQQYLNYPKFLFYLDSAYVLEFLNDLDDFSTNSRGSFVSLMSSKTCKEFSLRNSLIGADLMSNFRTNY